MLSPVLDDLASYPFVALSEAKARLSANGTRIIDFGVGEPRERTPSFIREALSSDLAEISSYPLAPGLPDTRQAIADWILSRFDGKLDPATEIIPTLGTKEAIFHLPQLFAGKWVIVTSPGYPVPGRGARFAGKEVYELELRERNRYLPDLSEIPEEVLADTAVLWLNYPNNPTGACSPLSMLRSAAELAQRYDFVLASDEAYSELYFGGTQPKSVLQLDDLRNVVALNTLSKRSSMPGYRIGFAAGDPAIIAALKRYRPNVGVAPQEFVQRAGIAAWRDEAHVEEVREIYRAKRELLLPLFEKHGINHVGGDGTFFLWLHAGARADQIAHDLLERGIVLAPGRFFGSTAERYLRLALVPTIEDCYDAAPLIEQVLREER